MKASWYAVKNVKEDSAEISIYDEIGLWGISAKTFISELKGLGDRHVTLRLNSPGGEIFEGNAVYNALRRHPGGVTVEIDSLAASMATVIAMAGEKRTMAENGMFMIHNPWTIAAGESKDMRRQADLLDDLKSNIVSAYAGRTGMDRDDLAEMMDAETWLTAQEALDHGFITGITEPMQAAANFRGSILSKFDKAPSNIMATNALSKFLATLAKNFSIDGDEHTEESVLAALKDFPGMKSDLAAADAEVKDLKGKIAAKDSEITGYTAKISELGNSVNTLTVERDDFKSKLEGKTGEFNILSEQHANLKKLHGIAPANVVPPIKPNPASDKDSDEAVYAEYMRLESEDPAKATKFYREHKDKIIPFINRAPKKSDN